MVVIRRVIPLILEYRLLHHHHHHRLYQVTDYHKVTLTHSLTYLLTHSLILLLGTTINPLLLAANTTVNPLAAKLKRKSGNKM